MDVLLAGNGTSPFGRSLTGDKCPALLPVETIPDQIEHRSENRSKTVRLHPGILFALSPQSCSQSPGIAVRLHPGFRMIDLSYGGSSQSSLIGSQRHARVQDGFGGE